MMFFETVLDVVDEMYKAAGGEQPLTCAGWLGCAEDLKLTFFHRRDCNPNINEQLREN